MSSILTNDGASIALQTLKSINSDLSTVQNEISTGRKVATSKDNAAVWAIAKTMEADVVGYKQVSDSLALGSSTLSVARSAAETVTDLLTDIKGKVVAAQEQNVDREKIQANISALRDQIGAVVDMAQFNGLNLLDNDQTTAGSGSEAVLGSLLRVSGVDVSVSRQDLGTGAHEIAATGGTYTADAATATLNATQTGTIDASGITVAAGMAFTLNVFGTDADGSSFDQADLRTTTGATETRAEMAAQPVSDVARDGDTAGDVMRELAGRWASHAARNGIDESLLGMTASGTDLQLSSNATTGTDTLQVSLNVLDADADNTIGGGLEQLATLDVSTAAGAQEALASIESLLQTSISAAAAFGTDQNRLETQSNFNDTLMDAMTSGIGTLTDANLEESSARLQALQVQQQLATQALSIANNAPSALLGLFR